MAYRKPINRDPGTGNGGGGTGSTDLDIDNIDFDDKTPPQPQHQPNAIVDDRLKPPPQPQNPPVNPPNPQNPPAPQNPPPPAPPAVVTDDEPQTDIEIDGVTYQLDDKGNAIGADGKIFLDKAKIDELKAAQDELPVIEELIAAYGVHPMDETGKPKVYEDSTAGALQLSKDIAALEFQNYHENFIKKYPDAKGFFDAHNKGDVRSFYEKQLASWSNRKFDENNEADCLAAIVDDLIAKGTSKEEATEIANVWKDKGDDVLKAKGKSAYESRKKSESEAMAIEENTRKANEKAEEDYWINFWNKTQATVKGGKLRDVVIPETERDAFFNYLSADTGNGKSALQLKKEELASKNPEVLLQLDYLLFKDFNFDKLVKNVAATAKAKNLSERLKLKTKNNNQIPPPKSVPFSENIPDVSEL